MRPLIYDPRDRATIDDPLPALRRLQDEDPVHWSPVLRGWVITRYEDIRQVQRGGHVSADRLTPFYESLPSAERAGIAELIRWLNTWVSFKDPPEHGRLKSCLSAALTVRDVASLTPQIEAATAQLLDRLGGSQEFDLIAQFAFPLPATVIMFLCGLPREDMDQLKGWSERMKPFIGSATASPDKYAQAQEGAREMAAYFKDVVRKRRAQGGADLISRLMAYESDKGRLTDDELVGSCMLFLFGGHETTTNLIGNGMRALLRFPQARKKVLERPEVIETAVEEVLRFDGPTGALVRVVNLDHELQGKPLVRGQRVFLMIHAANHDPRAFHDPEEFDVERSPNPHLTFNYGTHFCLGAPLARLEGRIALQAAVRRLPTLRLAGPIQYMDTLVMRGVRLMPCALA